MSFLYRIYDIPATVCDRDPGDEQGVSDQFWPERESLEVAEIICRPLRKYTVGEAKEDGIPMESPDFRD